MGFAGIDIGSRTIEVVVVDDRGELISSQQADTGFDPMASAESCSRESTTTASWPPAMGAVCLK